MSPVERTAFTKTPFWRNEALLAQVRIVSGFILFAYVLLHFINHSFGLISLELMGKTAGILKTFWRWPPLTIVLYGALAAHFSSALLRIFTRRTLSMPAREWVQLTTGIAIPLLLVVHVMGTRYAAERYGINDTYAYVLLSTFVFSPINGWLNAAGLVAAWMHGCLGLHMWVRVKPWYTRNWFELGLSFAVLLPALSLAGYLAGGRAIVPLSVNGEFMERYYSRLNLSSEQVWVWLARDTDFVKLAIVAALVALILARFIRTLFFSNNREIAIDVVDGPTVRQPIGASLLDMHKAAGVPHASVCGGKGRCSTCRVRVLSPDPAIEPAGEAERKVLKRVNAPNDVRLACQMHPRSDIRVIRLLPSDTTMTRADRLEPWSSGREKVVTVMFADLRNFTETAESRLPFDVVYLINQFSSVMGKAVETNGGRIDKFLGDGFMALFGVDGAPEQGAREALYAAQSMLDALATLNDRLADDLDAPLRIGVGLHSGPVILGDMGYGPSRGLTAIGDTVNTASRLEAATKTEKCTLVVSAETLELSSTDVAPQYQRSISIRGKQSKQAVVALSDLSEVLTSHMSKVRVSQPVGE